MKGQRGFTIMELMVVLIIAGIMVTLVMPGYRNFRLSLAHDQTMWQVMEDLRAARQLAITRHCQVVVVFGNGSTTTNVTTYKVLQDNNNNLVADAGEPQKTRTIPTASKLSNVNLTPTDSLIYDISGMLVPRCKGGKVIVNTTGSGSGKDTIQVSITGQPYHHLQPNLVAPAFQPFDGG